MVHAAPRHHSTMRSMWTYRMCHCLVLNSLRWYVHIKSIVWCIYWHIRVVIISSSTTQQAYVSHVLHVLHHYKQPNGTCTTMAHDYRALYVNVPYVSLSCSKQPEKVRSHNCRSMMSILPWHVRVFISSTTKQQTYISHELRVFHHREQLNGTYMPTTMAPDYRHAFNVNIPYV